MHDAFTEPVDWRGAALAFTIWMAHFGVLWGASSIFPDASPARWIALIATVLAMAALVLVWRRRSPESSGAVLPLACALAAAAVLFGAMPAVIG
ncbi:type VI protein secretion system component VasK [Novosphingobium hassiacum]|uniref:Type VI protein secretion system component VasK n=1 Tax=Novosphingobium hassiacum TaxID=173676 RepID=A0A7W6EW62_9SPHN|nr:hypothetical protein [Novosphingobium hassiacum]MBB3860645.1 type VI protein secretion system component VasK [Novosphingobium hassiacum]